ncbi:hypothetical protein AWENTII_011498 [Aspergillus wentii]
MESGLTNGWPAENPALVDGSCYEIRGQDPGTLPLNFFDFSRLHLVSLVRLLPLNFFQKKLKIFPARKILRLTGNQTQQRQILPRPPAAASPQLSRKAIPTFHAGTK